MGKFDSKWKPSNWWKKCQFLYLIIFSLNPFQKSKLFIIFALICWGILLLSLFIIWVFATFFLAFFHDIFQREYEGSILDYVFRKFKFKFIFFISKIDGKFLYSSVLLYFVYNRFDKCHVHGNSQPRKPTRHFTICCGHIAICGTQWNARFEAISTTMERNFDTDVFGSQRKMKH